MTITERNWSGHHPFSATAYHRPESIAELQEIVARSARVKAVGARHSFNAVADTPGEQVSLERLDRIVALNPERRTVTIEAGMTYTALGAALHEAGFALHNTASLPRITVAGAVATGTHGSGDRNGCLSTAVSALELITADGERLALARERDGERFRGAVVGLGALGVVATLTLDIAPTYQVAQTVYERLPTAQLADNFGAIMGSGYSVSLFHDWSSDRVNQVWVKRRVADGDPPTPADLYGATRATDKVSLSRQLAVAAYTEQQDLPGPWHERLPHFNPDGLPERGSELQSEYFVDRADAPAAFRALDALRDRIAPLMGMGEFRSIAADDLWLSMAYERETIAFHFTWRFDWPAVRALLPDLEAALAPFAPRPHWGKLFAQSAADLAAAFPRLPDFRALARDLDPAGKFRNPYLDEFVFGEGRAGIR